MALKDIRDVDGFVGAIIARHPQLRDLAGDEREELECEAFRMLCELAARHDPDRASFSTFAGVTLRRRLVDAWHGLHPEHQRRRTGDGERRRWDHGVPPVSLDVLVARDDPALSRV